MAVGGWSGVEPDEPTRERRHRDIRRSSGGEVCVKNRVSILCVNANFRGKVGQATPRGQKVYENYNKISGYEILVSKWITMYRTLTLMDSHPPLAQSDFRARSFAPVEAPCNGNTPSRTKLIGVRASGNI
jgi:hypothetical protein